MRFKSLILVICLGFSVSILGFAAEGATWLDPSLKWNTIETLHFSIHYHDGLEPTARRLAPIAENVYSRLTPLLKNYPRLKTDVVLLDTSDYSNGFTNVSPNPLITLYVADIGGNLKPSYYDDWLGYVFLHEYTHLLNLDFTTPGYSLFRMLFGRWIFPNALAPTFMLEGIATYMETKYNRGGRGYDPRFLAMVRMDVLENNMKSLDQAAVDTVRWPDGQLRYLYGVMFYEYLADTYGEDRLLDFVQAYGDFVLSSGIDAAYAEYFGKSLWILWDDWQEYLKKKYDGQRAKLTAEGLTEFKLLTDQGYFNLNPCWSSDSRSIFYNSSNADTHSQIVKVAIDSGKQSPLVDGLVNDDALSLQGDELYYTLGDIGRNFYIFKDIYKKNVASGRVQRLTLNSRAADPSISKDGKWLAFTTDKDGLRTLWISDLALKNVRQLGSNTIDSQYLSPRFSPDGRSIAVAKFTSGHTKIYLVDTLTGAEKPLIEGDLGVEGNPAFSPDGKYVLFDSDRSGVVNLYAFELGGARLYQVTNVLGAAMMPAVSGDGRRLAFVSYSSRGYDLAVMDYDPLKWKPVFGIRPFVHQVNPPISPEAVILDTHGYNPLPALLPKFWIPYSFYDDNGDHLLVNTAGMDSLQQHVYLLQAGMDWKAKRPSYYATYLNNQFLPQVSLVASDIAVPYDWDSNTRTYWERQRLGGVFLTLYGNRVFSYFDRQAVSLGYVGLNLINITSLETLANQPALGDLKGVSLIYSYTNRRSYGYSVAPEEGVALSGRVDMYSRDLGSKFALTTYLLQGSTYWSMPLKHNVLGLNLAGFYGRGDRIVQTDYTKQAIFVPGYVNNPSGNKAVFGSLNYYFPISYPEVGLGYGYFFLDRISGKFFFDQGGVSSGAIEDMLWQRSAGAELNFSTLNAFGNIPLSIVFGYAKGLDKGGEDQIYVNISL